MRLSHEYKASHNWGQPQPLKLDSIEEYIEAAYERRLAFKSIVEDFAKAAGPGVEVVPACVKGHDSASRKLWDRTSSSVGYPNMIGDYLRARVLVPANPGSLGQLHDAMEQFRDHPLMSAYKDRIYRPNGSGFRAMNGLMHVEGMHAELQIIPDDRHGATRVTNRMTEVLRDFERAMRLAEERFDMTSGGESMIKSMFKLVNKAEETISIVRDLRSSLHEHGAEKSGVNAMLAPELAAKRIPQEPGEVEKLVFKLGRSRFGRNIAMRLEESLQPLLDRPAPRQMVLQ